MTGDRDGLMVEKQVINTYLGTPFKWAGRKPGPSGGMDCWTLVASILRDLGHKVWEIDGVEYPQGPDAQHDHFIENYHKQWEEVPAPEPFDVVLMKGLNARAGHVGVALSNNRMIHCPKGGVIVSYIGESIWSRRILGFYRMKVAA